MRDCVQDVHDVTRLLLAYSECAHRCACRVDTDSNEYTRHFAISIRQLKAHHFASLGHAPLTFDACDDDPRPTAADPPAPGPPPPPREGKSAAL